MCVQGEPTRLCRSPFVTDMHMLLDENYWVLCVALQTLRVLAPAELEHHAVAILDMRMETAHALYGVRQYVRDGNMVVRVFHVEVWSLTQVDAITVALNGPSHLERWGVVAVSDRGVLTLVSNGIVPVVVTASSSCGSNAPPFAPASVQMWANLEPVPADVDLGHIESLAVQSAPEPRRCCTQ